MDIGDSEGVGRDRDTADKEVLERWIGGHVHEEDVDGRRVGRNGCPGNLEGLGNVPGGIIGRRSDLNGLSQRNERGKAEDFCEGKHRERIYRKLTKIL